jgi:hypothetical protein
MKKSTFICFILTSFFACKDAPKNTSQTVQSSGDLIATYREQLESIIPTLPLVVEYDETLLIKIVKDLGSIVHNKDSEVVNCANPKDIEYIKQNFMIGKLKFDPTSEFQEVIKLYCNQMGNGVKNRAVLYYLIVAESSLSEAYMQDKL